MKSLSNKEKIEALEFAKHEFKVGRVKPRGICEGIARWLRSKKNICILNTDAINYVPELLDQMPVRSQPGLFWWPQSESGDKRRITAINKTIKSIKSDLQ